MVDFLLIFVALAALLYLKFRRNQPNLPPGPISLPIIGSLIQVVRSDPGRPFVAFQKLARTYGNIMSLQLGSVNAVVISGFERIKEMETHPDFINRVDDKWMLDKTHGLPFGLIFSRGDFWAETRRVTHRLLKDFGYGKQSTLESLILEELQDFCSELKSQSQNQNVVEITPQFFNTIFLNVIWSLMTGTRFKHDDPEMKRILHLGHKYAESVQVGGGIGGLFPKIIELAPGWTGFTKHHESNLQMLDFAEGAIERYRLRGTYETKPENFIECFLQLIHQQKADPKSKSFETPYTDANLAGIIQDLAIAGNDTQAHLMNFAVRYLLQYPEVQAKLRAEIDGVLGRGRWVTLSDRPRLTYTQAAVFELLRITTILPIVRRKTYKDCILGGYNIPKGTLILPNYWGANMDEAVWEDPHCFRPERFLNANGEIFNTEKILSFGIGKRVCIGESLAKSAIFMTLASLVQQFVFEADPASGIPPNLDNDRLTRNTMPYKAVVKVRS